MRICAICETPYQVMTMMNYALNRTELLDHTIDLYVGSKFRSYLSVSENVSKEKVFDRVFTYDYSRANKMSDRLNFISAPGKYISRLCDADLKSEKYSIIFISNLTTFAMSMILANPDSDLYYYDDGIGSYRIKVGPDYITSKKKMLFKLYKVDTGRFTPKYLYLNNTSMFIDGWDVPLVQMPPLSDISEEFDQIMSRVFGPIPDIYGENKTILLTDPIEIRDEALKAEQERKKAEVISLLAKMNAVHRPHPRETVTEGPSSVIDRSGCLWEQVCMKKIDSEYTLIGTASTAMFSPKFFFDKEPRLIFLFKALDFRVDESFMQLLDKLVRSYKNPEDIMVLDSIDDLSKVL